MTKILDGKTAFVTGASRGIGAAIACGLAEHGSDVILSDVASQQKELQAVSEKIASFGRKAICLELDVTSGSQILQVVEDGTREMGQIDILVNNAGILKISNLINVDEDLWDAHFDVNAKGMLFVTNAVLPQMKARKDGRIINIASIAGRLGQPTQGHYAATKATAISLTKVYAQEHGMDGITVNAVCPGIIMTDMGKNNIKMQADIDHWTGLTALRRLGDPVDVVGPTVFFASPLSGFVTGQSLNVCGGVLFD